MDEFDRDYLADLIVKRTNGTPPGPNYWQGRIDEYASQNAIGQIDADGLDLRLFTMAGS